MPSEHLVHLINGEGKSDSGESYYIVHCNECLCSYNTHQPCYPNEYYSKSFFMNYDSYINYILIGYGSDYSLKKNSAWKD